MLLGVQGVLGGRDDEDERVGAPVGASSWHVDGQGYTWADPGGLMLEAFVICRRVRAFERASNVVLPTWLTLEELYPLHSLRDRLFGCTLLVQNAGAVELHRPCDNWDVEAGDADLGNILGVLLEGQTAVPVKGDLDLASFSVVLT